MIAPSLGRLVRSTWQQSTSTIEAGPVAASHAISGKRPISGHQRRHSSSKTPQSSGDGVKVVGGRAQRAAHQNEQSDSSAGSYEAPLRSMGRRRRRQDAQAQAPKLSERFSNLPSVPPTNHLDARDVGIASFFSQHRPISITTALPTPTSTHAFASIFDSSKHAHSPDSIENTRQKMRQILLSFRTHEASSKAHLAPTTSDPSETIHLDGFPPTPQTLDRVLQGASFRPPPPPEPGMPGFGANAHNDTAAHEAATAAPEPHDLFGPQQHERHRAGSTSRRSFKQKIQRKSWSTTIIVTETTDMLGGKSYATTNSPIVQIPSMQQSSPVAIVSRSIPVSPSVRDPYVEQPPAEGVSDVRWRQPFLQRMWLRQRAYAERQLEEGQEEADMLLISVKRQRKLKMKKHKYKKLMRRTRNLRRKLGRD